MINIQESVKTEYIKDSVPKVLTITDTENEYFRLSNNQLQFENFKLTESLCSQDNLKFGLCEAAHCEFKFTENGFDDISKFNLITAPITFYNQNINLQPGNKQAIYITDQGGWSTSLEDHCFQHFPKKYTCASFLMSIDEVETFPTNIYIQLCYDDKDGNYHEVPYTFDPDTFHFNWQQVSIIHENVAKVYKIEISPGSDPGDILKCRIKIKNQMVCTGDIRELLPITFIQTDWNSVCFSEDFKDKKIKAEIKLRDYVPFFPDSEITAVNWYNGTTNPASVSTKSESGDLGTNYGTNIYLRINVTDLDNRNLLGNTNVICVSFKAKFSSITGSPYFFNPRAHLKYRGGETYVWQSDNSSYKDYEVSDMSDWTDIRLYINYKANEVSELNDLYFRFKDQDGNYYESGSTSFTFEAKEIVVSFLENLTDNPLTFSSDRCYIYNGTFDEYYIEHAYTSNIPLGFFNVKEIKTQYIHNLCEKTITAYDDLLKLEANAMDWYTSYMFGVDTDSWTSNGFEFARQIFSSYFNYVIGMGLDSKDNYKETRIAYYDYWDDIKPNHLANIYKSWDSTHPVHKIRYCEFTVSDPDPSKLYMVTFTNTNGESDYHEIHILPEEYFTEVDALGRGVATNGSILIKLYREGLESQGYCINKGDYFMIPEDCTSFKVLTPCQTVLDDNSGFLRLLDNLSIYEVDKAPKLVNGHIRLVYYNYGTKELFDADTSITGRDVIHSLLEPCGCFFRLSRQKGIPEFIYPTKSGLYPSNTLYPADDIYPRAGTDGLFSLGRYISFICEDFEVKNYGRIQILKKANTNKNESVCEWEYIGNADEINTYIFDDNIFYCADGMMYDYDLMPEVSEMLENMFINIANLGYTPNDTNALGMPWLECGDRIGLLTFDGGVESFIFRRTLKGIQNLKDIYESRGDEYTEAIDNYGYKILEANT